jgi:hypothetical protein
LPWPEANSCSQQELKIVIPTIQLPNGQRKRVDEMEKTDHYRQWKKDFSLLQELGIEFLRYGPPYYRTHVSPGCYDWGFSDETFNALKELNVNSYR